MGPNHGGPVKGKLVVGEHAQNVEQVERALLQRTTDLARETVAAAPFKDDRTVELGREGAGRGAGRVALPDHLHVRIPGTLRRLVVPFPDMSLRGLTEIRMRSAQLNDLLTVVQVRNRDVGGYRTAWSREPGARPCADQRRASGACHGEPPTD